jgi:hypothetical protein
MRTEDDLRDALFTLETQAPAALRVLPERRTARRRTYRRGGLVVTAAAGAAAVVVMALLPQHGALQASAPTMTLRARLLAALEKSQSDIMYMQTRSMWSGGRYDLNTWYAPWGAKPGQEVRVRRPGASRLRSIRE